MSAIRPVIAGLGMTEMGKVYGRTTREFGTQAVQLAAADAGIPVSAIDGLLINAGATNDIGLGLAQDLGLEDLSMLAEVQQYGSSAGAMIMYAAHAIEHGLATTVACVFADTPLKEGVSAGAAYGGGRRAPQGWGGLSAVGGAGSTAVMYALAARRHMDRFGTTNEHFGRIAVAQREWAALNPLAQMQKPMSMEDYHSSRWIAEPFHLLDCCLVSNGGVAIIVTSADRATDMAQPPVPLLGYAQSHPGRSMRSDDDFGISTGAVTAGPKALAMAGVTLDDIDVAQLYDCFTFTVLVSLEDYGFCAKGEGGDFVSQEGLLGPNGRLKLNTGGGELSGYYMWGMTPLTEGVMQARGTAGERQVEKFDHVLVSGNGGVLDHHASLVLGSAATL